MIETRPQLAHFFLRLGLAFVLIYFGIGKAIHPGMWTQWIPVPIFEILPMASQMFLLIQGVIEAVMGVLILFNFLVRPAAILLAILLIVVLVAFGFNEATVRDIGLLGAALYLVFQPQAETS